MNSTLENLVNQSKENIPVEADDYVGDDGLLYCGKCHTRKQTRIELFDKILTPMCICSCEKEKLDAEQKQRELEEKKLRIQRMRKVGFPDEEMQQWTFANDDKANMQISKIAMKYAENFKEFAEKGKGLLLYGSVGTGKTYYATCIANELINKGYPCLVTNFARLINTIQGMYEGKQNYIDSLNKFDLLVIDDLAAERDTEYMNEIVFNIIDARYRSGKPLIVTTNLTSTELNNPVDVRKQRIYSRLTEMCLPFEVKGVDRRKKNIDTDLYKILGF